MRRGGGSRRDTRGRSRPSLPTILALGLTLTGGVLLAHGRGRLAVRETTVDGLFARLERAEWLVDGMDHSTRFPRPASMMPGMPPPGVHRLSAELALVNRSPDPQRFDAGDLHIASTDGGSWEAVDGEARAQRLEPGQMLNTVVRFDVPEPEDREARADYWLVWRRHGRRVRMPVPQPPFHHPDELLPEDWPASVTELPPGDAAHGGALFADTYGCASCHGLPAAPGSDTVGPHLAAIARDGATREAGKSTAQYVYESILAPNAFIAPTCPGGERCPAPSTMPDYAALLRKQDMADLIAYLAGAS